MHRPLRRVLLAAAVAAPLGLAAVTLPHTFSNGAVADADQVNANFAALAAAIGSEAVVPLTDAPTIAVDAALGTVFEVTLTGNRTLGNPTNVAHGRRYRFLVRQDAVGGRSLAFGGNYRFPTVGAPNLSTAAATTSILEFVAVDGKLHLLGSHVGPCAAGAQVFHATGSDQLFTVPAGCTSVSVKLWGAGGGGGGGGAPTTATGGGGGHARATLAVAPGENLTILVGAGGHASNVTPANVYGGGGRGCGTNGSSYGAGGGGRSAIRRAGVELVTAGAGGGGQFADPGGAGGGLEGVNGSTPNLYQSDVAKGFGGTQLAGGAGGCGPAGCATAGTQFQGGGHGSSTYTAGGGGGYFGGGGGGTDGASSHDGGGGGSSSVPAGGVTSAGSGQVAGNTSDPDWEPGVGRGGDKYAAGNPGLVVVRWGP